MNRREFLGTIAATVATGVGCTQQISGVESGKAEKSKETVIPKRVLGKTGVEVSMLALGGVIGMKLPPSKD